MIIATQQLLQHIKNQDDDYDDERSSGCKF